jgi:hypothetical protein
VPGTDATRNEISGGIFFSSVIQGRDVVVHLPPEITPALSGLPGKTPAFTGRHQELDFLRQALAPRSGNSEAPPAGVVTTVSGIAGIGKTELVLRAAHIALAEGWFPGGVLFADLASHDPTCRRDASQVLEGFLRALGVPRRHIPLGLADRSQLYTALLATLAKEDRRILVVIDAASREQAAPLMPRDSQARAVVTCRGMLRLPGARALDLSVLPTDETVELLRRILAMAQTGDTRVADEPDDAARIADLCGGLPLAVRIAGALLAEDPGRPLATMAADLDDKHTRLDEMSYPGGAVRAAFDLSYRQLDAEGARLFRLLPLNPGPDISAPAAAVLAGTSPAAARRTLTALAQLIEQRAEPGLWRMHDLVRLYADEHGRAHAEADGRAAARVRLLGYHAAATGAADADPYRANRSPGPAPLD